MFAARQFRWLRLPEKPALRDHGANDSGLRRFVSAIASHFAHNKKEPTATIALSRLIGLSAL
jgi:hypothetical protein